MAEVVRRRQTSAGVKDADPYGQLARRSRFEDELAAIRMRSRSIWSRPDTSLTTNGHFYGDPEQDERTSLRPTSVARRNNPHPKLVFMRTGMKEIPNAYGAPPAAPRPEIVRTRSVTPAYLQQLTNLSSTERQGVAAFLKSANEDSKHHVVQAVEQFRTMMNNDYECPPIGAAMVQQTEIYPSMDRFRQAINNEKEFRAINQVLENPQVEVKLVDNQRPTRYSERDKIHFQRRTHSHSQCPWPLAHRPYRGDYSIHMDWHPRLPHHRLPCLC